MLRRVNDKTGFTLMEVIVVVVVLSVIAILSYPTFMNQIAKIRSQEGANALIALYTAQKSYYSDHGVYTTNISQLEVTFPSLQSYFSGPYPLNQSSACSGNPQQVLGYVSYQRNLDYYTLYILGDGRIVCNDACSTSDGFEFSCIRQISF